jgi:hypothetical protein
MPTIFHKPIILLFCILLLGSNLPGRAAAQADNPSPPSEPVKLIFIHHSTGENWLTDGYGNLGQALAANNYFVSDTNYGWGPDGIGDNTDIPNWTDWFRSERTPVYMEALFNESEQHANYTRSFGDPGGENVIVMFKSCFPNSALEGSPNDAPDPDGWLSVGHAKYVYNEILQYFATRPDKLFIVITAPPLSDGTYAANARAFNNWLLNDWLAENGYTLANVAVFDFYNILTSPDAHHHYAGGQIEHIAAGSNTLAYPSGDDHPSEAGSQKATDELIPLLNIFYNRWQANAPAEPPEAEATAAPQPTEAEADEPAATEPPASAPTTEDEIDNFEASCRMSSGGWQTYWDEATTTRITCAPVSDMAANGARALQIDFAVAANAWATCELHFDEIQNWTTVEGLSFNLHAAQAGLVFNVDVQAGDPENVGTYAYTVETPPESVDGWIPISLRWSDFHRVAWEENADAPLDNPASITGVAFGFSTLPDAPNTGAIWVDDLRVSSAAQPMGIAEPPAAEPTAVPTEGALNPPATLDATATPENGRGGGRLPCGSSLAAPLAAIGAAAWAARRKSIVARNPRLALRK